MNWLEFLASIIGSFAWPATIILLVLLLRKPLAELIPFLERLKFRDLELNFGQRLMKVSQEAQQLLPPAAPLAPEPEYDRLDELADVSPRAAVLESWLGVETAAVRALQRRELDLPSRDLQSPLKLRQALSSTGTIDSMQASIFDQLRSLRNAAAHAPDFSLGSTEARQYADTARRLTQIIDRST